MEFERLNYYAISPDGMKRMAAVYDHVARSSLPKDLVLLAYLRVSQINGCAYCISLHTRELLEAGVPLTKLSLVVAWREAGDIFDARERVALAWAEAVTRVEDSHVPSEKFDAAREVFSEPELVDLTIAVSIMNAYNRMAISFRARPLPLR